MICPKCGTVNTEGFKFCVNCGGSLENNVSNTINNSIQGTVVTPIQPQVAPSTNTSSMNYVKYFIGLLTKPFETYKGEEEKLSTSKVAIILSGIVAGAMMLIRLLTAMISSVFVKTMDYSTFKYKTEFNIEGLKNLDYLSLIGKNLLIYIGIIVVIAVVYYLASLVVKKALNFMKTLSITASAFLPYTVMGMIVSPLLGKIWTPLSIVAMVIGIVYSIILFVLLITDNLHFERKDLYAYFHLVCMTILTTAGYYVYIHLMTSNVANQIGDILDMFN